MNLEGFDAAHQVVADARRGGGRHVGEGGRHEPRSRPHRQSHLQVLVGGLVVERDPLVHEVVVRWRDAASRQGVADLPREVAAHREAPDERVVDAQLDVVLALRDVAPDGPAHVAPLQPDPEDVVAVERERVARRQAPVRREGQVLAHPGFLARRVRQPVGLDRGPVLERADGEAADLGGRGDVAIHQRRGHREHLGVVVEAEAGHVARQQRLAIDLQIQQVAHGVDVLGSIQAVRRHAARVGVRGADPIELRLERRDECVDRRRLGPRSARRWHQAAAELAGDLLEELAVHIRPADVDPVEHHAGRLQPLVVAGHAVPVEQRARRRLRPARGRRPHGRRLRRGLRGSHDHSPGRRGRHQWRRCRRPGEANRAKHSQRGHMQPWSLAVIGRLPVSCRRLRSPAAGYRSSCRSLSAGALTGTAPLLTTFAADSQGSIGSGGRANAEGLGCRCGDRRHRYCVAHRTREEPHADPDEASRRPVSRSPRCGRRRAPRGGRPPGTPRPPCPRAPPWPPSGRRRPPPAPGPRARAQRPAAWPPRRICGS